MRKKRLGRPKMAKNERKKAFPLRLRPDLIKEIKRLAGIWSKKPGPLVEEMLEERLSTD